MTVFDRAYEGVPSWEIGHPQGAVVRLSEAGLIAGSVLDVGCGTGRNSLLLAELGHPVLGIDIAAAAIERATAASAETGVPAQFLVLDAFHLAHLERTFDTIIDIGLFHTLQPFDRATYAASLRTAMAPGGCCFVLCWSDRNAFGYGPQRTTRGAIRSAFSIGWRVEDIRAETLETRLAGGTAHAWLARLRPRGVRGRNADAGRQAADKRPMSSSSSILEHPRVAGFRHARPGSARDRIGAPTGPGGRDEWPVSQHVPAAILTGTRTTSGTVRQPEGVLDLPGSTPVTGGRLGTSETR